MRSVTGQPKTDWLTIVLVEIINEHNWPRRRNEYRELPQDSRAAATVGGSRSHLSPAEQLVSKIFLTHDCIVASVVNGTRMIDFGDYLRKVREQRRAGDAKFSVRQSVTEISTEKGDVALPENETVTPDNLVVYRKGLKRGQVRESVL